MPGYHCGGRAALQLAVMNLFRCAHCQHLVYFENHQCLHCGHALAYLPEILAVTSLDEAEDGTWTTPGSKVAGKHFRLCANTTQHQVCNWAVPAESTDTLCAACRLTHVIPNLAVEGSKEKWYKLEAAKRRLVHALFSLRLPVVAKVDDQATGLEFQFLADPTEPDAPKVMTGHADGVITIALAEADDAERERRRTSLHEPMRTLLGHFRHEVGHYYWDRLVRDGGRLEDFRAVFGDERADYAAALKAHYEKGPREDWREQFISAYAASHPWEDWAETWAHYLHMADALETAAACRFAVSTLPGKRPPPADTFAGMMEDWHSLTHLLNNLNRGLGLGDAYPFVLSPAAQNKMRFVHETIHDAAHTQRAAA